MKTTESGGPRGFDAGKKIKGRILEEAVQPPRQVTVDDVLAEVRRLGLSAPAEAAAMVRADRDHRYRDHR